MGDRRRGRRAGQEPRTARCRGQVTDAEDCQGERDMVSPSWSRASDGAAAGNGRNKGGAGTRKRKECVVEDEWQCACQEGKHEWLCSRFSVKYQRSGATVQS